MMISRIKYECFYFDFLDYFRLKNLLLHDLKDEKKKTKKKIPQKH